MKRSIRPWTTRAGKRGRCISGTYILDKIRSVAGRDCIKRFTPIQNQGDHKTQDILFVMDDKEYTATLRYNNAMTEGRVEDLRKQVKKC